MSLNKAEGMGAGVRALIELGAIELVGKLTSTPYWKCLEIDKTNPLMVEQARDWYDGMKPEERVRLVQRKLAGMDQYRGPVNGIVSKELTTAIGRFQADNGLIADGRINFELYFALLDADQAIAVDTAPVAPVASAAQRPAAATGPLTVKLDTDRGPRPVYRPKDFLNARVQLSGDGILYCYYRDNGGVIARIFPNRFNPDPFVRAGRSLTLPPEGSPFKIRFDQTGQEQLLCFASERDLPLPANLKGADLMPLKVASLNELSTAFRKLNPNVAEAKLDLIIR